MRALLPLFRTLPLVAALLGLLLAPAAAQQLPPDTLLRETFRATGGNWPVEQTDKRLCERTDEGYHMRYLGGDEGGNTIETRIFTLNDAQDYSLELTLRMRGRAGLLWGYQAGQGSRLPDDLQILRLETNGATPQLTLMRLHHDKWKDLFTAALPAGFDAAAAHTLRVSREGHRVRFYVDNQAVGKEQAAEDWPGPSHDIGLYLEGPRAEAWFSQLLLRHYSRIRLAPGVPRSLRRERLAGSISTLREELVPRISADGRWLYFVRSMGNPGSPSESNQDVFVAERDAAGQWGAARNLGDPINSSGNNVIIHTAPDGQTLLVTGQYDAAGRRTDGDGVSQSTRQANGAWSVPQVFTKELNLPGDGEAMYRFIDASGTVALVSADTKRSLGNDDLYVSLRRPDGSWPPLRPLGATINTSGSEQAPFLAPDGKTLYFSSDGHPGYGSADIFVSTRLDDSWTKWSEPLNLGPGVNTPRHESYFSLPASGEYAYLTSQEPGTGAYDSDIYRLLLPKALRPAPTLLVRGRVLDARTNAPVANAELRYEQLPTGQEAGRLRLGGAGTYEIALPAGRQYGFRAEATGYLAASDNLDLTDTTRYGEVSRDLYLLPLTEPTAALASARVALKTAPLPAALPGQLKSVAVPVPVAAEEKITLNNLFFVRGKPELLPASFPELNRLAQTLTEHPGLQLRLDGHTDNTGDAQDPKPNQVLSEQRAVAVRDYLVRQRIAPGRLSTRGYGGSQPVAANDTEAHKRQNRRVECVVLSR
ncbi:MAG: OmpA family protein [Bacteroidota bacterium]|nr:OmpA family protein [Bacteroidota bacterium]